MTRAIKEKRFDEIISRSYFRIPENQRKFEWKADQALELIEDLLDEDARDTDDGLFLGNLITLREDDSERVGRDAIYDVVDGQQRLTTLFILLIAMRVQVKRLDPDDKTGLRGDIQNLISSKARRGSERICRFKPSDSIALVFDQAAKYEWQQFEFNAPANMDLRKFRWIKQRFNRAFDSLRDEISHMDLDQIESLFYAVKNTEFVHISLTTFEEAVDLFERTNARGVQLDAGDLIKNHLFKFDKAGFDSAWSSIEGHAEHAGTVKCLRYFHISKHGMVSKKKLYKEVKNEMGDANSFVIELMDFSKFFRLMTDPAETGFTRWLDSQSLGEISTSASKKKALLRGLRALKFFKVSQVIPVIYSAVRACNPQVNPDLFASSQKNLVKLVCRLEDFHFRHTLIAKKPGNQVENLYAEYAEMLTNTLNLAHCYSLLQDALDDPSLATSLGVFKDEFEQISYSASSPDIKRKLRYIFDRITNHGVKTNRLDMFLAGDDQNDDQPYNVEHFYALNIEDDYEGLSKNSDDSVINNIGNLLVLSKDENGSLQNLVPSKKISKLSEIKPQPIHLQRFLEGGFDINRKWDAELIEERARYLAEVAYETKALS